MNYLGVGELDSPEDIDVFQFELNQKSFVEFMDLVPMTYEFLAEDGSSLLTTIEGDPISTELEAGLYYIRVSGAELGMDGTFVFLLSGEAIE